MTERKDIPTIRSVKKEMDSLADAVSQLYEDIPQMETRLRETITTKMEEGTLSCVDMNKSIEASAEALREEWAKAAETVQERLMASEKANEALKKKLEESVKKLSEEQAFLDDRIDAQKSSLSSMKDRLNKERTLLAVVSGLAVGLALVAVALMMSVI